MKKWSLRYELVRRVLSFAFSRYYLNVEIFGRENIPPDGPVIFCENHSNAVIDPVIIASKQSRQPGFLARSDVFRNKFLGSLFRTFKMLPIYRQRDGVNTIEANQPIFDAVVRHLNKGGSFIIAPEGDKGIDQHLLPLKKGVARIAVQQMAAANWEGTLCLVPVGMAYSGYDSWGREMTLRFGPPIYLKKFKEAYEEDPSRIFKTITAHLAEKLKPLMWHVEERSWLPWLYQLKKLDGVHATYKERMDWSYTQLQALQQADEATLQHFQSMLHQYLTALDKKGITDKAVATAANSHRLTGFLLLGILAHFALLHAIFHYPPLHLANWIVRRMEPHPHFHASILFGLLLVIMPVFYLIYFIVAWVVAGVWWAGVLLMLVLPLIAAPSRWWHKCWRSTKATASLIRKRREVLRILDEIVVHE